MDTRWPYITQVKSAVDLPLIYPREPVATLLTFVTNFCLYFTFGILVCVFIIDSDSVTFTLRARWALWTYHWVLPATSLGHTLFFRLSRLLLIFPHGILCCVLNTTGLPANAAFLASVNFNQIFTDPNTYYRCSFKTPVFNWFYFLFNSKTRECGCHKSHIRRSVI